MKPDRRSVAVLLALVLVVSAAMQWWGYASERRHAERLAALAQPGDIRMIASVTCAFCAAARHWMTEHRVRFDECYIERDAQCKALYDATQARGTPTLIVRGQVQLGFDAARVLAALEARGRG
jgi:glutaredoxin